MDYSDFESFVNSVDIPTGEQHSESFKKLYKFGGFPEPLLAEKETILNLWRKNRLELLIRQDLRDLTHIHEISQVEVLASLLPMRVGSALSVESFREVWCNQGSV